MNRQYKRDRGLPGSIDETRLARLLSEKRMPRIASVSEAMAAGYEPIEGLPGHFRRAHAIWALRKATDGQGFVLVRLRDEPAPGIDPRRATTIKVEVQTDEEEVVAPERDDEVVLIPIDMPHIAQLYMPGDSDLKDDEYVPEGGSTAPLKKRDLSQGFGHASDIGSVVTVTQSFSPSLYGNALVLPKGRVFEVAGQSAPNPDADKFLGLGFDEPVYPGQGEPASKYVRIRLQDDLTGVEVAVLPWEFNKFMSGENVKPTKPYVPKSQRAQTVSNRPKRADDDETMDLDTGQYAPHIPRDPRAPTTEQILRRQEEERQMRIDRGIPAEETVDLSPNAKSS